MHTSHIISYRFVGVIKIQFELDLFVSKLDVAGVKIVHMGFLGAVILVKVLQYEFYLKTMSLG